MIHGLKLGIFPSKLNWDSISQEEGIEKMDHEWISHTVSSNIKMLSVGKWLLRTSFIFTCRTSTGPPSVLLTGFLWLWRERDPFPNFCRWEHDLRINFRTSVWTVRKRHVLPYPQVWENVACQLKLLVILPACLPESEWYTLTWWMPLTTFFFNCSAWLVEWFPDRGWTHTLGSESIES